MIRDEIPNPPEMTQWGLPLSFFKKFKISEDCKLPTLQEGIKRFEKQNPGKIAKRFQMYTGKGRTKYESNQQTLKRLSEEQGERKLQDLLRNLQWADLIATFSLEELLCLMHHDFIMSTISEVMDKDPQYMLFRKLENSLHHWGTWAERGKQWHIFARYFNEMINFDIGLENTETYIDFASWHNPFGHSQYSRIFVDGSLCYHIVQNGKRIMTIGFSITNKGILLTQIQLAEKKGNRWLFKLGKHYFDYVIERFHKCFSFSLWFVTGESLANHVCRVHTDKRPEQEVLDRIASLYNRELSTFIRTPATYNINNRQFQLLTPAG